MADESQAVCGRCKGQRFFLKRTTGDRGETIFFARCTDCSTDQRIRVEPELQWLDELPFR